MTILPIPFDILDAAAMKYLPYIALGCRVRRNLVNAALINYNLWHNKEGNLGSIGLRKISNSQSDLYCPYPPFPSLFEGSSQFSSWLRKQDNYPPDQEITKEYLEEQRKKFYESEYGEDFKRSGEAYFRSLEEGREFTIEDFKQNASKVIPNSIYQKRIALKQKVFSGFIKQLKNDGLIVKTPEVEQIEYGPDRQEETPFVPKRPADLKRWKEVYPVLRRTREIYIEAWRNGATKDPTPSFDDYRDALADKGMKRFSNITIGRILEAGDAGLLK